MAPTGTPVLAPVSGVVVMTHTAPSNDCLGLANRGDQISIKGDDGHAYYLGHFLMGSLRVKTGDRVTSGERIAQVGTIGNAQCTVPHLHIQQNPAGDYGGQQNSFNIQPILVKLFHICRRETTRRATSRRWSSGSSRAWCLPLVHRQQNRRRGAGKAAGR